MAPSGGNRQVNPCCGIKLKVAVVVIAVVDIVFGISFLVLGLLLLKSPWTPIIFKKDLEMINLVARPGAKFLFGLILLVSAKLHIKWGGMPSVVGCALWVVVQIGLFAVTVLRLLAYLKYSDQFLVKKSGATTTESFAIFSSILPFCSVGVLWYEIVAVCFFIVKLIQDSRMIKATAIALEVAQNQSNQNEMYNMSQTPNIISKEPMKDATTIPGETSSAESSQGKGGGANSAAGKKRKRRRRSRKSRASRGKIRLKGNNSGNAKATSPPPKDQKA